MADNSFSDINSNMNIDDMFGSLMARKAHRNEGDRRRKRRDELWQGIFAEDGVLARLSNFSNRLQKERTAEIDERKLIEQARAEIDFKSLQPWAIKSSIIKMIH